MLLQHRCTFYLIFESPIALTLLRTYLELRLPLPCTSSSSSPSTASSDNFLVFDPLPRPLPRPTAVPLEMPPLLLGTSSPLSISVSSRITGLGRRPAPGLRPPRFDLGLISFNSSSISLLLEVPSSELCSDDVPEDYLSSSSELEEDSDSTNLLLLYVSDRILEFWLGIFILAPRVLLRDFPFVFIAI